MRVERSWVGVAAAMALALGFCAASGWRELDSVDALEAAFAADQGQVRLVLLLSPT